MSFFRINIQDQYRVNAPLFDLKNFNEKFNDLKLISSINTLSDDVTYKTSYSKTPTNSFMNIVDPQLAAGKNYYNPYEENYIDPNQDDNNRLSLLVLINKFNKTILVMTKPGTHHFYIPGGKCKIFESFENSAIRNFEQLTRIRLDSEKITPLVCNEVKIKKKTLLNVLDNNQDEKDENNNILNIFDGHKSNENIQKMNQNNISIIKICTHIAFVFDEYTYRIKHPNCQWIPFKRLQYYHDKIFAEYYKNVYLAILQYIY